MADILPSEELVDEASDFGTLGTGTRLGRYELLVPIARGGMARVWAARLHGQRGFQKLVALKTILPHLAKESEFERMFLDEARIASGVHHPNVCEIYELGEDKNVLYLAMEWVGGDSFSRVLRPTNASKMEAAEPRVAARVIADACAGLHAAHELTDDDGRNLGVVHRDLSPHNVLLTADGVAKVADFGVAKALGQLHEATSAGQLKGKISYMSPEQVTGGTVDRRSDVFSLGVVLYEATTGQRPFKGDGDHQVMHALLKGEFPAPTTLVRGYPLELERIVVRALSPQAILRFPTAERMRFALEEFLAKGHLVTQSHVAQLLRARLGEAIERRKERIRQAGSLGDAGYSTGGHQDQRSGVKPSPWAAPSAPPPQGHHPTPLVPPPNSAPPAHAYTPQPPGAIAIMTVPMAALESPLKQPFTPAPGFTPPGVHLAYGSPNAFPSVPEEQPSASTSQYILAAGVGVLLALVIGTGGFLAWRATQPSNPTDDAALAAPSVTNVPSPEITFSITPADAAILAEGNELSARSFPRPRPGKTVAVVIRANGFEEQTLLVDHLTPSPTTITLRPRLEVTVPPAEPTPAASVTATAEPAKPSEVSKPRPRPAAAPAAPAIPANPY